jgi:hypothetical protein
MIAALLELQFAEPSRAAELNCQRCHERVRARRRCHEARLDFTVEDDAFWPMQVVKGGQGYGFCPGKATRDVVAVGMYNALVVAAETGAMWESGGLSTQPAWWVELVAWFIPSYTELRFMSRARAILGDGKPRGGTKHGPGQRNP